MVVGFVAEATAVGAAEVNCWDVFVQESGEDMSSSYTRECELP